MTVAEFIAVVRTEAGKHAFTRQVVLLDETDYAAKLHLVVRADLFVQLYANVQSGTRGYALVYRGQRIYGRDRDEQGWHRHRADDPQHHDVSDDGSRGVEVGEFLREIADVLEEYRLL